MNRLSDELAEIRRRHDARCRENHEFALRWSIIITFGIGAMMFVGLLCVAGLLKLFGEFR